MPVARYFLFVGGVLLALLYAINVLAPAQVAVASGNAGASMDKTVVRIRSDAKLPERVVYDTSLPTIVPLVETTAAAAPPAPVVADATAKARVRETFAQFVPAETKKVEPPVQRKRKIAKSRSLQPPHELSPLRVAQQSHFGFFGGPGLNNTW